ncbi:MAG: RNB domain-containing ribonuclease, partial [Muribaculaceae bacterium]|nr:RNB domain-containing ribonuclease [Muribaculaceae bacterium]
NGKKKPKPFVYRIHDKPDEHKLMDLAQLARGFGYKIKTQGDPREINRSVNKMLADIKGKAEENYLGTLAIRSMAKAIYSTSNIGHYGLGFEYYTHFTSPIRRYPDMMVHRLLDRYLNGGRAVNNEKLEEECKHSSNQEQLAANAERASIKYKQVEFMSGHLGEQFAGVITGVTEWGLYVELEENLCEGLIPVRDLTDDYYDFDDKTQCLIGRRHGMRFRLGDRLNVVIARADVQKKQLDMVLAGTEKKQFAKSQQSQHKPHDKKKSRRRGRR